MGNPKISLDQLGVVVQELIDEQIDGIDKAIEKATKVVRGKALKNVKAKSPVSKRAREKKYNQGWGTRTEKGRLSSNTIIYNKEQWQLTHLLENGHFIFNQHGGSYGRTGEYPHIGDTQELVDEIFEEELIKEIEKII
ncbi:MAG: hypothetical protein Q4A42_02800 [Tissierellia bacterium]|nr:hypothetical protein [Tissierellia bacterium]